MKNQHRLASIVFACFLGIWLPALPSWAQAPASTDLEIPQLSRAPKLADFQGMAPQNEAARVMHKVSGFSQRNPHEGEPASQRTEVYLGVDDTHFYAVFLVFDTAPETIRHSMAPREQVSQDDTVSLFLDTFNDRRRAYVFTCNARGVQRDGIYTELIGEDRSFHTVWRSEGRLTDQGFMVLMAIPFRGVRFPAGGSQTWGVMFSRNIVRLSEDVHWPGFLRSVQGRLSQAGTLRFETRAKPKTNYQFLPYVTSRAFKVLEEGEPPRFTRDDSDHKAGADAKFVFRDSLVLDLTANPDFSQVESDAPQVTVNNRFELNFPELRPFFTENADVFRLPINLAFTRRIGEPEAGARLTGKIDKTTIGALVINDSSQGDRITPGRLGAGDNANHGIVRIKQDVFRQGHVGAFYSHTEFAGSRAQILSADALFRLSQKWSFEFQAVRSERELAQEVLPEDDEAFAVAVEDVDDSAYQLLLQREGNHFTTYLRLADVGENFGAPLAFLGSDHRPDNRNFYSFSSYRFRPKDALFFSWGFDLETEYYQDQSGQELEKSYVPALVLDGSGRTSLILYGKRRWETLREGDLGATSETTLKTGYIGASFASEWSRQFRFYSYAEFGVDTNYRPAVGDPVVNGDATLGYLEFTWRPISPFRLDQTFIYYRLADQTSSEDIVSQRSSRLKLSWQFDRRLRLRLIGDYESIYANAALSSQERSREFNGDLLLTYQVNPWTAFYLGYNTTYDNRLLVEDENGVRLLRRESLENNANQVFLKFSYLVH